MATETTTEISSNGFTLKVIITEGKMQLVLDDATESDVTVIDMYRNDQILRVGTDKTVRTSANTIERMCV